MRKDNLVRIAVVCGVDRVNISGIKDKKPYKNYQVSLNNAFPMYFSSNKDVVVVNGRKYRGNLEIRKTGERLWVINILNIEDYLKGVVPCEIGKVSKNLIEVAKAQAVAARTYACAHLNQYQNLGFDLYATIQDQVYKGIGCENEFTNRAIDKTKGLILTYKNRPIEAKYHSTCGGKTADFNDAWSGNPSPYLKSVNCSYCQNSPHYKWQKVLSKSEFFPRFRSRLKKIGVKIPDDELIRSLKLIKNKRSKRAIKLIITTEDNKYKISGYNIRTVFGDNKDPGGLLKSNFISIKTKGDKIIIEGKGWGHGVGMCQFGAIEMARKGKNYKRILYHYYSGTRIKKIK
ncbi:SpoIID/LytB domain-containing protein [candidate division WOR-3 bacterium]|jgi:stage II sporulation protein D|nr:SpoIID/LytB domain-containing protein [candidate division WOR-3 bacterium]